MKYIYFDTGFGFSPTMALGALIDMFKEEGYINSILRPFASAVYTENVRRGCFEGCLAHIDLGDKSRTAFEGCTDSAIRAKAERFAVLSPESDLREILEAVCVGMLIESFGIDGVYYGKIPDESEFEFAGEALSDNCPAAKITPSGYALLKLLGANTGVCEKGEISLVGYGADSIDANPDGILRSVMYEENQSGLFAGGRAFEALFTEETAIL